MGVRKGRETAMRCGTVPRFVTSHSTLEKGTDMKIQLKTLAATVALITGIISAPAAHADGDGKSMGSMMGQGGMMQGGQMMGSQTQPGQMMQGQMSPGMMQGGQGGQMGQGGMMGMMGQMSQMMGTCNQMMQAMMQHPQENPRNPGQTPKKNNG
jgi:hypothetical protein